MSRGPEEVTGAVAHPPTPMSNAMTQRIDEFPPIME